MYAVIRTGGKQYKVQAGDVIRVEKLDQVLGDEVVLTDVLMVGGLDGGEKEGESSSSQSLSLGFPQVSGVQVTTVVTKQTKDRKVIIFKKRRRQGYRKFKTHRQPFTELFIKSIAFEGQVSTTGQIPEVVDVDQRRKDRIQSKIEAREFRRANRLSSLSAAPMHDVEDLSTQGAEDILEVGGEGSGRSLGTRSKSTVKSGGKSKGGASSKGAKGKAKASSSSGRKSGSTVSSGKSKSSSSSGTVKKAAKKSGVGAAGASATKKAAGKSTVSTTQKSAGTTGVKKSKKED